MKKKIIVDKDFFVDVNKKIFQYTNNEVSKSFPLKNIICCEVYADTSVIESETYIETSFGIIPFFEDLKELKKMVFSAGTVLRIFFEDETGEIKSYSKKYGKEERKPYEIRHLINNLIDEEMTL